MWKIISELIEKYRKNILWFYKYSKHSQKTITNIFFLDKKNYSKNANRKCKIILFPDWLILIDVAQSLCPLRHQFYGNPSTCLSPPTDQCIHPSICLCINHCTHWKLQGSEPQLLSSAAPEVLSAGVQTPDGIKTMFRDFCVHFWSRIQKYYYKNLLWLIDRLLCAPHCH